MVEKEKIQKALDRFVKHVTSQAKRNLTNKDMNVSKKLYNSIKGEAKVMPNSIGLYFYMEDHGLYQDLGVKGKDPSKVSKNAKKRGQQAPNSPFKFGSGKHAGQWDTFLAQIEKWAKKRNIRFRDVQGKYKKGDYKQISRVIASNIYARGLAPTLFFTKPFQAAFKNLPDDLAKEYGLEVAELFKMSFKIDTK